MKKGQSLWILTKMAMLFFIGALAIILVLFGGIVKGGLCESSAASTNARIANAINQVINSPLEDERRVIPLETSLAIGESKSARYSIEIAKRTPGPNAAAAFLIITTRSEIDRNCASGLQVSYPKSYEFEGTALTPKEKLFLVSDRTGGPSTGFSKNITILPSLAIEKQTSSPRNYRSKYIVVMSCTNKTITREKYLFLEDCANDDYTNDPNECLNFNTGVPIEGNIVSQICSFG